MGFLALYLFTGGACLVAARHIAAGRSLGRAAFFGLIWPGSFACVIGAGALVTLLSALQSGLRT